MLLFLLGLVFTIPLAILANMLTPRMQIVWAHYNATRRAKRIAKLQDELATVQQYRNNTNELVAYAAGRILFMGGMFSMAVIINLLAIGSIAAVSNSQFVSASVSVAALAVLVYVNIRTLRYIAFLRHIYRYESYEKRMNLELADLGVSG